MPIGSTHGRIGSSPAAVATSCGVDFIVMHGYALLASRLQGLLRKPAAVRWQNRFFGGLLMAVGAALAFVKRAA